MLWEIVSALLGIEEEQELDITDKIYRAEKYIAGCKFLPAKEKAEEVKKVAATIFENYFFSEELSRKSEKRLRKFLNKYSSCLFSLDN